MEFEGGLGVLSRDDRILRVWGWYKAGVCGVGVLSRDGESLSGGGTKPGRREFEGWGY